MQQQTIGRYQVLEEIASGGQGTVYRAWDTANDTVVALKVLHPHLASDLGVLERFRREAQHQVDVILGEGAPESVAVGNCGGVSGDSSRSGWRERRRQRSGRRPVVGRTD